MAAGKDAEKKQINVVVERGDSDVLEAIAFLRGVPLSEVARDAVRQYVDRESDGPRVQDALRLRRAEREAAIVKGTGATITDVGEARRGRSRQGKKT